MQPGTVLLNLVSQDEPLLAEVLIENQGIGFVAPAQPVRVKLAAYEFQKHGMLDGIVKTVSADSSLRGASAAGQGDSATPSGFAFKALVELREQRLTAPPSYTGRVVRT